MIIRFFVSCTYGRCDYCKRHVIEKPLFTSLWLRFTRRPWLCIECAHALEHTQECNRRVCLLCDLYNGYLEQVDINRTVDRLLKDVGLKVMPGPDRQIQGKE